MKIYKTVFVSLILILSLFMTTASAKNIFTINDDLDDVMTDYEENVSYPDTDIKKITINRVNDEVELILELNDDGNIPTSNIILFFMYVLTTHNTYTPYYGVSAASGESIDLEIEAMVMAENDEDVMTDYSINKNKLTMTFNLLESYERIVGVGEILLTWAESFASTGYYDEISLEGVYTFPSVDADGPYKVMPGDKTTFNGTLDEGNPNDYTWIWTIDGTSITKEGQNAQHTFLIPGNYTGTLYVFNDQGQYNIDSFEAQVKGTVTNGNDNNNGPGFEILLLVVAFAVALIILRKRK